MKQFLIIQGILVFVGVLVSDSVCQEFCDQKFSKQTIFKSCLKRLDKNKLQYQEIGHIPCEKLAIISSAFLYSLKYQSSQFFFKLDAKLFTPIRAPPLA